MFNGKTILITGGTGSLGKKLTQVIFENYKPRKLIIFSRDELKQFEMAQRWNPTKHPIKYILGDVRDKERLMTDEDVERVIYEIKEMVLR